MLELKKKKRNLSALQGSALDHPTTKVGVFISKSEGAAAIQDIHKRTHKHEKKTYNKTKSRYINKAKKKINIYNSKRSAFTFLLVTAVKPNDIQV
jgi:predicted  nucleic acid-binding Zn-ribbon protein